MKIETLTSEHDLWQLFGGEGPETKGAEELTYADFFNWTSVLDISGKKKFRPRFRVSDTDHLYLLRSLNVETVVDQACLYVTAGKISDPDLRVAYLGRALETVRKAPAPVKVTLVPRSKPKATSRAKTFATEDTLDKIVTSYFATMTAETFTWRNKTYEPRDLWVRPGIVKGYTCPEMCGGCCPRFSLDYIAPEGVPEGEKHPLTMRVTEFNGRQVEVWSDLQTDHNNPKCRNLNFDNGRCGIHGFQPFSCDFELLRSFTSKKDNRSDFSQQLFGRGWAMTRVDGQKKALCEMTPPDAGTIADVDRRLARLEIWMTHFGLDPMRVTYIRSKLDWIAETGKRLSVPKSFG